MSSLLRDKLFAELKEDILEMAKSKYAHFFVQKMLRYGTKEQRAHIFKTMEGNIAKVPYSASHIRERRRLACSDILWD